MLETSLWSTICWTQLLHSWIWHHLTLVPWYQLERVCFLRFWSSMSTTEIYVVKCYFFLCHLQSLIPENSQFFACYLSRFWLKNLNWIFFHSLHCTNEKIPQSNLNTIAKPYFLAQYIYYLENKLKLIPRYICYVIDITKFFTFLVNKSNCIFECTLHPAPAICTYGIH